MSTEPLAQGARRALRIGKYEVVAHIATGGMGAVYKARDVDLGREVALKILPPEMAAKPMLLERFRREARSAAKLRHENIVAIYECGEASGTHFLALEFVDGIDLHEFIRRKGKLDPEEAQAILQQAAGALAHAHQQGIVHRDIKPSNFLIARKDGKPFVKLADMGLARETSDDEFRVTKDGTTVGTVDYMSPEQARDSGSADIRSDIYSLGCTFYHMLAGKAPFPEGSLTERIYKHVEAEPDDIRQHNPKTGPVQAALLRRMLAKRPVDRYQTPEELLHDLEHPEALGGPPGREILADLDKAFDDKRRDRKKKEKRAREAAHRLEEERGPSGEKADSGGAIQAGRLAGKSSGRKSPARERASEDTSEHSSAKTKTLPKKTDWRPLVIGGVIFAMVAAIGAWVLFGSGQKDPDKDRTVDARDKPPGPETKDKTQPKDDKSIPKDKTDKIPPINPGLPLLYQPRTPIDVEALRREFKKPEVPALSAKARRVRVARGAGASPDTFASLAEACKATAAAKEVVVEIHDNGPLFEPAIEATDRSITIRAGQGYRPLVAWDVPAGKSSRFLSMKRGTLTLEGLDLVVWNKWRDGGFGEPASIVHVASGNLAARNCTFSTSGQHPYGVALARLVVEGKEARGTRSPTQGRCVLRQCYARGSDLTVLAVNTPGAEILIDNCLLVGGDKPLLQIAGRNQSPSILRVLRSTLVAPRALLKVEPADVENTTPDVRWHSWDSLLAQNNSQIDGDMVVVPEDLNTTRMTWQAVNCLYAGWKRLLATRDGIPSTDLAGWQKRWKRSEGDKAVLAAWPKDAPVDPEEGSHQMYRTLKTEAGFAATSGKGALGCEVDALPWDSPAWLANRKAWMVLTYKRFPTVPPLLLEEDKPEEDHKIDLSKDNLGQRVRQLASGLKAESRLVLRLTGSGPLPTDPIRIKGIHLVLFYDPPKTGKEPMKPPPVLIPHLGTAVNQDALIDVEEGRLDLIGVRIRFANSRLAKLPRYMIQGKNADIRLFRCHLEGPVTDTPEGYRGLIRFVGSGKADPDKTPACAGNESVLISNRKVLHLEGAGARLSLANSLIVAAEDAIHLDPGPGQAGLLNVQCLLEKNTFALKQALFHLGDAPRIPTPLEPIVVQADNNLFLDPFTDLPRRSALLRYEGTALPRGMFLWQGKDNGYDSNRLQAFVASDKEGAPPTRQLPAVWQTLWGSQGEQKPRFLDLTKSKTASFGLAKLQLERLILPLSLRPKTGQPPLGAKLEALGIGRKK